MLGISNGMIYQNNPLQDPPGSIEFDGTNDYMTFHEGVIDSTTGLGGTSGNSPKSFQFWMRPDDNHTSSTTMQRVIAFNADTTDRYWGISLGPTSGNVDDEVLCVSPSGSNRSASQTNLSANTWYHIVLVWDGTSYYKIYINGVDDTDFIYDESNPTQGGSDENGEDYDITTGWSGFEVGRGYAGSSGSYKYIDGRITEIASWNVSLPANAVSSLYNNGTPVNVQYPCNNYTQTGNVNIYFNCHDNSSSSSDTATAEYATYNPNNIDASNGSFGTLKNGAARLTSTTTSYYPPQ